MRRRVQLLALFGFLLLPSLAIAADRPNVLFIAVDDLRPWLGCLGHPDVKSPNFDRLAARGTVFTRCYCAAPWCNPSRTALLTGFRPSTSGVYTHYNVPWRPAPLLKNAVTLPRYFRDNGYLAIGAGKIFHHANQAQDPDSWDDYWPSKTKCMLNIPLARPPKNGLPLRDSVDWGPIDTARDDMPDWKVAEWVAGQLGKKHAKPFFLGCGFFRPHLPWYVPKKYFDLYDPAKITLPLVKDDDLDDVGDFARRIALGEGLPDVNNPKDYGSCFNTFPIIRKAGQWREAVRAYLASVTFADECLGRVLDALDKSPYRDNTIIVLWSDHGWHHGEKLHWEKVALWEEATNCVLMIAGRGKSGQKCPATVNLMDVYPTLVDVCGLPPKSGLEGVSLSPLLANPALPWDKASVTTHGKDNHSVRTAKWRYIRYSNGDEELYDHDADPHEWTNLARDKKYAETMRELARWLPTVNAPEIASVGGPRKTEKPD
jgi:arylsulfatase A-like enzyme